MPNICNSIALEVSKVLLNRFRVYFYLSLANEEGGMKWLFQNSLHLASPWDQLSGMPSINLLKLTKPTPQRLQTITKPKSQKNL